MSPQRVSLLLKWAGAKKRETRSALKKPIRFVERQKLRDLDSDLSRRLRFPRSVNSLKAMSTRFALALKLRRAPFIPLNLFPSLYASVTSVRDHGSTSRVEL